MAPNTIASNSSSDLVWLLVNKHNSFKVKGRTGNRKIFTSEPGNLYGLHSYKHSGLANERTIDIKPGEDGGVTVTTKRSKNANKPAAATHSYTTKRSSRRSAQSVGKEAKKIRPDLAKAAQARVSAIFFAQRKAKYNASKNN